MIDTTIQSADYTSLDTIGLFGSSLADYEETVRKLLAYSPVDHHQRILEVIIWDDPSNGHRVVLRPGSSHAEVDALPIVSSQGCTVIVAVTLAGATTNISLGLWQASRGCLLRGFLYLGHLLTSASTPHEGLNALLDYSQALSHYLGLEYLSLTRDSDVAMNRDPQSGVVFPSLFGVFSEPVLQLGDRRRLQTSAINLLQLPSGWAILSVLSVDELLRGTAVQQPASEVFQTYSSRSHPQ